MKVIVLVIALIIFSFAIGVLFAYTSMPKLLKAVRKRYLIKNKHSQHSRIISNAMENKLSIGPKVVAVGGGTGLSTLLAGLKGFTKNITAVVAVTDEGGSSGRLRQEWGMLPPGDIRNCIVALAENDNSLNTLLNFRFDKGELKGHSLGNLILLAATEIVGDFQTAVKELNKLLAIRGQVLPVTTSNVVLKGETKNGKFLSGELEISENGSNLKKIWLEPADAVTLSSVKDAFDNADIIVLGPGSLFTSVMPNLLMRDVAKILRETDKPIVYIANLMTQPKETDGMNIVAHIDWVVSLIGSVPNYILANQSTIPLEFISRYGKIGAEPLYLSSKEDEYLSSLGSTIIYGDYCEIKDGKYLRHNAINLSETIMEIVQRNRKT